MLAFSSRSILIGWFINLNSQDIALLLLAVIKYTFVHCTGSGRPFPFMTVGCPCLPPNTSLPVWIRGQNFCLTPPTHLSFTLTKGSHFQNGRETAQCTQKSVEAFQNFTQIFFIEFPILIHTWNTPKNGKVTFTKERMKASKVYLGIGPDPPKKFRFRERSVWR